MIGHYVIVLLKLFRTLLYKYILCRSQTTYSLLQSICRIKTQNRRVSSTKKHATSQPFTESTCELDSHADTIVAGRNCLILNYTGKECDVALYRDDYEAVTNVPIVTAATAWQSTVTGQTYILVFHEALWMGDTLDHTLLNPNQLRHFGVRVQDDPTSPIPLSIISEDKEFRMGLQMKGTIVYTNTSTPTDAELHSCPHIELTSKYPWDPHNVSSPKPSQVLSEVYDHRSISANFWSVVGRFRCRGALV